MVSIEPRHAAELYDRGHTSGPWVRVTEQRLGSRRWCVDYYLVIADRDGRHYGLPYALGLTEEQENALPWEDTDKPIPLVRLYPHEVTTIEYRELSGVSTW